MGQYSYLKSALSVSASLVTGKKICNTGLPVAIKAKDLGKIGRRRALTASLVMVLAS